MYRRNTILKEEAEKRLKAIREFTDLGSGIKIAMRDLEIRGAGNLLGAEQSGHMEAVGYDLYCKMLNEAVLQMKGQVEDSDIFHTSIDLSLDAYIPATYVRNESQKLELYKRIAMIEEEEEKEDLIEELIDRYGEIPASLLRLLDVSILKHEAHLAYMTAVEQKGTNIHFIMYPMAKIKVEEIGPFIQSFRGRMKLVNGMNPTFVYDASRVAKKDLFDHIRELIGRISTLMEEPAKY